MELCKIAHAFTSIGLKKRGKGSAVFCNHLHSVLCITVCNLSYLGLRLSWTLQANELGGGATGSASFDHYQLCLSWQGV